MSLLAALATQAVQTATAPAYRRFLRALENPRTAQIRLLDSLIHEAAGAAYGRAHNLISTDGLREFRQKIPVVSYAELRPWIERSLDNEPAVLTPHKVLRIAHTSGSGGTVKTIPYTAPALRSFSRMFALWTHDVLRHLYRPSSGRVFLCVTAGSPETEANRALADDRDYLAPPWNLILKPFVVAPNFGSGAPDPLQRLTGSLAQEPRLEVFSFWSPSLLLAALDRLGVDSAEAADRLWPRLQLISCWTSGSSARFVDRLKALFPRTTIQGKGLVATEAPVSFPIASAGGSIPFLTEVFLEFLTPNGETLLVDELLPGEHYEIVVSTRGGFLRYRLGDTVFVPGFYGRTPVLEFSGRTGMLCDLAGEKLASDFVERELGSVLNGYFCLLPADNGYELWLENPEAISVERAESILARNPHYARARLLGQLDALRIRTVAGLSETVSLTLSACPGTPGPLLGDVKPPLLLHSLERAAYLRHTIERKLQPNTE